jgi:hypothetical protein
VRVRARQDTARPGETLPFQIVVGSAKAGTGAAKGSIRVRRSFLGKVLAVVAAVLAIAMVAMALGRSATPSEAKDVVLASTTTAATTTTAPVATELPSTTVPASTTVPLPTTTAVAIPAAPTTTTPVAVATTTTSAPPVVAGQPESVATTAPATTIATTTTLVPITMVTIFFPPVLQIATTTTTTTTAPPVIQHSFQDILVTFSIGPFPPYPLNCTAIHSPTATTAYTSPVQSGWTIDTSKGDAGHPGLSDIIDFSNLEAKTFLTYDYQPASSTTFAVTGSMCNASPFTTATFQHMYRVWLQRTV